MKLKLFRRIRKIWTRLLVVGILLLVGLLVLLETSAFQQFLLQRISNFARTSGIDFSASYLDLNLWKLQASLDDVAYGDRKGTSVTAERLTIDVPWDIFSTEVLVINDLEIDGLSIRISSPEQIVPEPSGQPTPLPRVRFDRLVVRNGSLTYNNRTTDLSIPAFSIDAAGERGVLRVEEPISLPPDSQFGIREIPLRLTTDGLQFGPSQWTMRYGEYNGAGSAQGDVHWAPSVALNLTFATDPLSIQTWRDIRASGQVGFENGVLKISQFRVLTGDGQATGSAEVSDRGNSANMLWTAINLDAAGFPATTEGSIALHWTAADFSDASGQGVVSVSSRQYGQATSRIDIQNGKAGLRINGRAMGAVIAANIITGLDRTLSGTFNINYNKYGRIALNGSLGGTLLDPRMNSTVIARGVTYQGVGPLDGRAQLTLRSNIVSVTGIQAVLGSSRVDDGFLQVNLKSRNLRGQIPNVALALGDFLKDGQGLATASVEIGGSIDQPAATIAAQSDGLDIGGSHIDSVALNGRLDHNVFNLEQLIARQSEGALQVQGSFDLKSEQIEADVNVVNLKIDQVRDLSTTVFLDGKVSGTYRAPAAQFTGELRDVIYQGLAHGNLDLSGSTTGLASTVEIGSDKYSATAVSTIQLRAPYSFDATLTANKSRIQYQQYDVTANGKVQAFGQAQPFNLDRIAFDNFSVLGEGINFSATGSAGAAETGVRIDLTADLQELPVEGAQLRGTARAQATLRGTVEKPLIDGTIETTNATVRLPSMTEDIAVQANVDFTRDQFTIRDLRADFAGATAQINGRGDLKGAAELEFRAENIRPERLLANRPVSGLISAEGTATLTSPTIEGLTASAKVTQMNLTVRDVEIHQAEPIELTVQNQVLEVRHFTIEGPDTRAEIRGSANLQSRTLNFDVDADTNLRIIEAFVADSIAQGRLRTQISLRGTPETPNLNGFVDVSDTQFQLAEPPLELNGFNARVELAGNRLNIIRAGGEVNGGQLQASGGVGISTAGLSDASVQIQADGIQIEYPEGLQSEINTRLALDGSGSFLELSGNVDIISALYSQDIDLSQEVRARLTNSSGTSLPTAASQELTFLQNVNLDLTVRTVGLVTVANNLANLDMTGAFQVRGTLNQPVVLGRAAVNEGGELYFGPSIGSGISTTNERRDRYSIETGTVEFNNPIRIEPTVDFLATHELNTQGDRFLITLRVTGTPATLKTELTSDSTDPVLTESDIITMLLTGRNFQELQGSYEAVAREQFANYLSGQVSGFFDTAGTALGLDTVRLEPVTLASQEDLSARLTVAKDITRNFNLAFSQNLKGARSQTWIGSYQTVKNLLVRGINDSDKREIRFELQHDLRIGGGPALPRRVTPKNESVIGEIVFSGTQAPAKDLLKKVSKPGEPFNAYRMNNDVRELREYFTDQDFLDVKIRARRDPKNGHVDVEFLVDQGPKLTFIYEGAKVPGKVQEDLRQLWIRTLSESASLRAANERLLRYFRDEGYLEAKVGNREASVNQSDRRFIFAIEPGAKFRDPEWVFEGSDPIDISDSAGTVMENPEAVKRRIEFDLQQQGFLAATATVPALVLDKEKPYFQVTVDKGAQYSVSVLEFDGNQFFAASSLSNVALFGPTDLIRNDQAGARPPYSQQELEPFPFTSDWIETARQRVTAEYWQQGFNDVVVSPSTGWDRNSGNVTVHFAITEGERQMVEAIRIDGADVTDMSYVNRQFLFKEGDPVDYARINLTRKKLYDTRLFKRVEIEIVKDQGSSGYIAQVHLNETAPWRIRYGFALTNRQRTSDRELGVSTELTYGNLFGKGITTGLSFKTQQSERDARVFASFPVFLGREVNTTAALFRTRDTTLDPVIENHTGVTLQQQWRLHNFYILSYDYSYRKIHQFNPELDPDDLLNNLTFNIGRFNATLSRDTRDDILNATRGNFFSNSFEFAPPGVGSQFTFIKNYSQYYRFKPVKENLVWASAVRVGLGRGFGGQDLIPDEQFVAGGGTSVRAFEQDGLSEPGNATLIVNQEIRAALFWRLGGVAFLDVGNIYKDIRSLKPWDLRYSPGVGLRVNTPLVLLRFDIGFNVRPRPGEPSHRFVFGIGQAF